MLVHACGQRRVDQLECGAMMGSVDPCFMALPEWTFIGTFR